MITPTISHQLKLKFYYDHVQSQVYSEGLSPMHETGSRDVVQRFIDPLDLPRDACVLDLGCGAGYFLDLMRERGYTNVIGITLSRDDLVLCQEKQHTVLLADMNFLTQRDESVDLVFCRHSLEHSPFPYFSLIEYNRVLRNGGILYVEVPQPDSDRPHETNRNHYSIMGRAMWLSLLHRTGFDVSWYDYEMPVRLPDQREVLERSYVFVCRRRRSMDIK